MEKEVLYQVLVYWQALFWHLFVFLTFERCIDKGLNYRSYWTNFISFILMTNLNKEPQLCLLFAKTTSHALIFMK